MIFGVGTDLVEIERMRRIYDRWGERAVARILTVSERDRLTTSTVEVHRKLALQFAGKEAVVKAFGTGFTSRMTLHDVEILPDRRGRPTVGFSLEGAKYLAERGAGETYLSLTDDAGLAMAFCVMLRSHAS